MAGIWDSNLKRLVGANPQHFVTWLLTGAQITRELSAHLNRAIDIDILYEVFLDDQRLAFHLEFQRYRDVDMAKRVLEYNIFATCMFDCTVISFVIYLKKDGSVVESPLIRTLPDGREVLRFHFITIKLWEIATDELRQTDLDRITATFAPNQGGSNPGSRGRGRYQTFTPGGSFSTSKPALYHFHVSIACI